MIFPYFCSIILIPFIILTTNQGQCQLPKYNSRNYIKWGKRGKQSNSRSPKIYQINLDLSPTQRWTTFNKEYKQNFNQFLYSLKTKPLVWLYIQYLKQLIQINPNKGFMQEIGSISKALGVHFDLIYALNYLFEINTYCTSIIVKNSNDQIFHGRNLDYGMFNVHIFSKLIAQGQFYQQGVMIFQGTIVAGFAGCIDGIRQNSFSISINMPFQKKISSQAILMNSNLFPFPYILLEILINCTNFQNAVSMIQTLNIANNAYFIISGAMDNQGVIISRTINSVSDEFSISDNQWFIIQTNWNRNRIDPVMDLRKTIGTLRLLSIQEININIQLLYDRILTQYPMFTIFTSTKRTVMMSAQSNYFNMTIWE